MSPKLFVNNFNCFKDISEFDKSFLKYYNKKSDEGYFSWNNLHNDLSFLHVRMKIQKVEKVVANLPDKNICYLYKKFKTIIKSWISFEKAY